MKLCKVDRFKVRKKSSPTTPIKISLVDSFDSFAIYLFINPAYFYIKINWTFKVFCLAMIYGIYFIKTKTKKLLKSEFIRKIIMNLSNDRIRHKGKLREIKGNLLS